jgi:DNA polymerase I-like protein with 3'-5' exonuclease and polymerase domains
MNARTSKVIEGTMTEGDVTNCKVLFVSDFQRTDEAYFGRVLSDRRKEILVNALNRAGIPEGDCAFTLIYPFLTDESKIRKEDKEKLTLARVAARKVISESKANVIVPLGEMALNFITGMDGIHDFKCNLLKVRAEFGDRKAIPLPHPEFVQRVWSDHAYLSFGCHRISSEYHSKNLVTSSRKFSLSLDLSFEEIVSYLEDKVLKAPEISVDYETGRNQINTVGYAVSPFDAIAIDALPASYSPAQFYKLWSLFSQINKSDIPKISQNAIYESIWSAQYGVEFNAVRFDTMVAMKMLHPMLDKGLDNVGRLYTRQPYWKKDHSDWNNIRNWRSHLEYNCKDTCGAFEARINMENALIERGLWDNYTAYMDGIFPKLQNMTAEGVKLSKDRLEAAKKELEWILENFTGSLNRQTEERVKRIINPNSPKQVKELLKELKIKLPTKKGNETVSKDALRKLRKSYPDEMIVRDLIKISETSSQLETYFNFRYDEDSRLRVSADMFHNEFGEITTSKNPFGTGFNLDDAPKKTKGFLVADEGTEFLELSFYNLEQTYLAYDSGDMKMISLLQQGKEIPRILASRMFNKVPEFFNPYSPEYRIAEAALRAAAYGMSPRAFAVKCSAEYDRGVSDFDAKKFLGIVFELFPKLRTRQDAIQFKLRKDRTLENLTGSKVTYYDRFNDDLFRNAYEWGFRSLQADLLKELLLSFSHLEPKALTTDSVLFQVSNPTPSDWYTVLKAKGGEFTVNTVTKTGTAWGGLRNV